MLGEINFMNYLSSLNIGDKVKLEKIDDNLELKERLIDMGFTKNSEIECVLKACFNGPIAYRIKNTTIALRKKDAKKILVKSI